VWIARTQSVVLSTLVTNTGSILAEGASGDVCLNVGGTNELCAVRVRAVRRIRRRKFFNLEIESLDELFR
jgi:hypothetical protein